MQIDKNQKASNFTKHCLCVCVFARSSFVLSAYLSFCSSVYLFSFLHESVCWECVTEQSKNIFLFFGSCPPTFVLFFSVVCIYRNTIEQGRIHGQYQLRTGGQGRKCAFSHFSTRVHGRTDGRTHIGSYRVAGPQLKRLMEVPQYNGFVIMSMQATSNICSIIMRSQDHKIGSMMIW